MKYMKEVKVGFAWFMVINTTFNNISVISWQSVLLAEETGGPGENHRPVASHWQTLSHKVVSSTPRHERSLNSTTWVLIGTDYTGSCKCNYDAHARDGHFYKLVDALLKGDISNKVPL